MPNLASTRPSAATPPMSTEASQTDCPGRKSQEAHQESKRPDRVAAPVSPIIRRCRTSSAVDACLNTGRASADVGSYFGPLRRSPLLGNDRACVSDVGHQASNERRYPHGGDVSTE